MKLTIRETTKVDNETIYHVEKHAFGELDEAELTEKLLADPTAQPLLSLLAFRLLGISCLRRQHSRITNSFWS